MVQSKWWLQLVLPRPPVNIYDSCMKEKVMVRCINYNSSPSVVPLLLRDRMYGDGDGYGDDTI